MTDPARAPQAFEAAHHSSPPSSRLASVPSGLRAGLVVAGKYGLVRRLGTGAMGEVWAARHESLDEEVAIKLVVRNIDNEDGTSVEGRFLVEARAAASLSRKTRHIVSVTDHGHDGDLAYLVMELVVGESLDRRVARLGALPLSAAVPLVTQLARGIAAAHDEGVVHRDLKPSNVFVTRDEDGAEVVKILDFGIAKLRRGAAASRAVGSPKDTHRGFLLGTPSAMSPEQAKGRPVDHRADLWALAVIAYYLLTGAFPFDGGSIEELLERVRSARATPVRALRPDLPEVADAFFRRAFAASARDRFQSAGALALAFAHLEPRSEAAAAVAPSWPPPDGMDAAPSSPAEMSPRASLDPSLLAAGVPRPNGRLRFVLGALLTALSILVPLVLLVIYLERDPPRPVVAPAALVAADVAAIAAEPALEAEEQTPAAPREPSPRDPPPREPPPSPRSPSPPELAIPGAGRAPATPRAPSAPRPVDKSAIF